MGTATITSKSIKACIICGEIKFVEDRGRCAACRSYLRKYGKERPAAAIAAAVERRKRAKWCKICGHPKTHCQERCVSCYQYWQRTRFKKERSRRSRRSTCAPSVRGISNKEFIVNLYAIATYVQSSGTTLLISTYVAAVSREEACGKAYDWNNAKYPAEHGYVNRAVSVTEIPSVQIIKFLEDEGYTVTKNDVDGKEKNAN